MPLNAAQLRFFADYIQRELGIIYGEENFFQLEKRLSEVTKSLGLAGEEDLFQSVQGGISGHTKQLLLDMATNNETSFFRDPKVFQAIENHIIPMLRKDRPAPLAIRIWSAASSFGQEPYSLVMLRAEMALKDPVPPLFEIVATDISDIALSRAREGRYSQLEVQRGLSSPLLVKNFQKTADDHWVLKPEMRSQVQFKKQNLLEPFAALGEFDFILCRNVLIYQREEKKREIVAQMARRLRTGGFLVLGAAESLLGVSDEFEQICRDGAVFFRLK